MMTTEKISSLLDSSIAPPYSHVSEMSVLGGLVLNPEAFNRVSQVIDRNCFYAQNHKIIFAAISDMISLGKVIDFFTVIEYLQDKRLTDSCGGAAYLSRLVEDTLSSSNESIIAYAKVVKDKADKRNAKSELLRAIDSIEDGISLSDAINKIKLSSTNDSSNLHLDSDNQSKQVLGLTAHIDKAHVLKQLAESVSHATYIPASTVLMIGLSIFSSMSCRRWRVKRACGRRYIPIGMYVVAEQPSGVGKTWCTSIFERPFKVAHRDAFKQSDDKDALPTLFATNATPEALEQSLLATHGFFSAVSSEQGLFNSLLGKSYGGKDKANNNDVVLNGFDGEYISSMRIMRKGYSGFCAGGISLFAQDGSISTILEASNGTGLSERFLMICEPHALGTRDRINQRSINNELLNQYEGLCGNFSNDIINNPIDFDDLAELEIDKDGWMMIGGYLQQIEPYLADGEMYSAGTLRGAAGKADIQIIKIAANLHLLENGMYMPVIDNKHIASAIGIFNDLLESHLLLLDTKGIQGVKAEYSAILAIFKDRNNQMTERQIIESRKCVKPFKGESNVSEHIRDTLRQMTRDGLLIIEHDSKIASKKIYSLGQ